MPKRSTARTLEKYLLPTVDAISNNMGYLMVAGGALDGIREAIGPAPHSFGNAFVAVNVGVAYQLHHAVLARRIRRLEDELALHRPKPAAQNPEGAPRFHYERGGPEPSGHATIYSEGTKRRWGVIPKHVYFGVHIETKSVDLPSLDEMVQMMPPFLKDALGVEERLDAIRNKSEKLGHILNCTMSQHTFTDEGFKTRCEEGDLIHVPKRLTTKRTLAALTEAAHAYVHALSDARCRQHVHGGDAPAATPHLQDEAVIPHAYKPYQAMTSRELQDYLMGKVEAYAQAAEAKNTASGSKISTELRSFSEGTPIAPHVDTALRFVHADHPKKGDVIRLCIEQCSAIRDENYTQAQELKDQIQILVNPPPA